MKRLPKITYLATLLRIGLLNLRGRNIRIGYNTTISSGATLIVRKPMRIGSNSHVAKGTILKSKGQAVLIGNDVTIREYCIIEGGTCIGDDSIIAPGVYIFPSNHIYENKDVLIRNQGMTRRGVNIAGNVWLCGRAQILDGVDIGRGVVVAAGSVVNDSVVADAVVGGIPAKFIKWRDKRE